MGRHFIAARTRPHSILRDRKSLREAGVECRFDRDPTKAPAFRRHDSNPASDGVFATTLAGDPSLARHPRQPASPATAS
jgi:hypothetical protein